MTDSLHSYFAHCSRWKEETFLTSIVVTARVCHTSYSVLQNYKELFDFFMFQSFIENISKQTNSSMKTKEQLKGQRECCGWGFTDPLFSLLDTDTRGLSSADTDPIQKNR